MSKNPDERAPAALSPSDMLQTLPRVQRPTGAVAALTQAHQVRPTPAPRGMTLSSSHVSKRTQKVPSKPTAADHLSILLNGFLSTRTVAWSESAEETLMMLGAEEKELEDAAGNVAPLDGSLSARAVSVTLLCYGDSIDTTRGVRDYLDALAAWAAAPYTDDKALTTAHLVRFSVLVGADAALFADHVLPEVAEGPASYDAGGVDVCVRWVSDAMVRRAEFKAMRRGLSPDKCLLSIQNFCLSMKVSYGVKFHDAVTNTHSVPCDAWAHSVHDFSNEFFASMEGSPCVARSQALIDNPDASIESVGTFLRIVPRRQLSNDGQWVELPLEQAVTRRDAFHALLLANSDRKAEVKTLVELCQKTGLVQTNEDTAGLLLHTCAVQAAGHELRGNISLYATHHLHGGRRPGNSICAPGSWVWRFESAVVEVDRVLENFFVVPCSRDSVLPLEKNLERPFGLFFNRAFELYTNTFGTSHADSGPERLDVVPRSVAETPASPEEEFALAAFQLQTCSSRISVGDAYASLKSRGAPAALSDLMLAAALKNGIQCSVISGIQTAASALKDVAGTKSVTLEAHEAEISRLKRVADASLGVAAKRHRENKQSKDPSDFSRVKLILAALGLKKGSDSRVPAAGMPAAHFAEIVQLVSSCMGNDAEDSAVAHAVQTAKTLSDKGVLQMLAAVICVLGSSCGSQKAVFVVVQTVLDNHSVGLHLVQPLSGTVNHTTLGKIVDTREKNVLLLKIAPTYTRLSSTVG